MGSHRKLGVSAGVLGLLAAFAWMAMSVSSRVGMTYDELGHIASGFGYWQLKDYRVNAENGILATRASAAPLLSQALTFPAPASPHWQSCNARALGYEFFYESGNDFRSMLRRARWGTIGFGLGLLWLIWRWASGLFGARAGWLSLGLATFSPTLLAHSGLATSDLILAFGLLAAVSAWWLLWHRVTWTRLLLAGLTAGGAFTAKMSGLLLVPMLALLFLVRALHPACLPVVLGGRSVFVCRSARKVGILFAASAVAAVVSMGVIWAAYGFRFEARPPGASSELGFISPWPVVLEEAPRVAATSLGTANALTAVSAVPSRALRWARDHRVLPEAFLWGLAYTYKSSRERESFLMGEISTRGWQQFFPVAFLLKSTPAELALFGLGALALVALPLRPGNVPRPRARWLYRTAPLLVVFVVYWAVALSTPLNIGHRHLLPVYPVVFVLAGAVLLWGSWLRTVGLAVLVMAAAGWQIVDSVKARPFYLAYFSPFVGGAREGWRYLVDSSLDWGQGLPDLESWLKRTQQTRGTLPVFLTYFGSDSPRARGLPVTRFGDARDDHGARRFPHLTGGWYAISATYFQRVYLNLAGPWSKYEPEYIEIGRALRADRTPAASITTEERARLRTLAMRYEVLQFGRLRHFLQGRGPDEIVGASILLFKLTEADVALALDAPLEELNAHLQRSGSDPR